MNKKYFSIIKWTLLLILITIGVVWYFSTQKKVIHSQNENKIRETDYEYYDNGLLKMIINRAYSNEILYREMYEYNVADSSLSCSSLEVNSSGGEVCKETDYKLRTKFVYNGKTETITSYFKNGNIQTIQIFNDMAFVVDSKLLVYKEYTADGEEYLFIFDKNETFKRCTPGYGSLGEVGSFCRPYEKYLNGVLISTMDKKQIYKEYYTNGKLKLECGKPFKDGSNFSGSLKQSCTEYIYDKNGNTKKEEKTHTLSSWIV